MSRHKSYEREVAVERAMKAFWRFGYNGLGVRAIEEQTGLGRFAIRTDFGGKEGLFIEALERYIDEGLPYLTGPLEQARNLEAIIDIFEHIVTQDDASLRCFGCLIVNTVAENREKESEAIGRVTDAYFTRFRKALRRCLVRLQGAGAVRKSLSIDDAVDFIVGSTIALNIINLKERNSSAGRGYANIAIETVRGWVPAGNS